MTLSKRRSINRAMLAAWVAPFCATLGLGANVMAPLANAQTASQPRSGSVSDFRLPAPSETNSQRPQAQGPVDPEAPVPAAPRVIGSEPAPRPTVTSTQSQPGNATNTRNTPSNSTPGAAGQPSRPGPGNGASSNTASRSASTASNRQASGFGFSPAPNTASGGTDASASAEQVAGGANEAADSTFANGSGEIAVRADSAPDIAEAVGMDGEQPSVWLSWMVWLGLALLTGLTLFAIWRVIALRRNALELNTALEVPAPIGEDFAGDTDVDDKSAQGTADESSQSATAQREVTEPHADATQTGKTAPFTASTSAVAQRAAATPVIANAKGPAKAPQITIVAADLTRSLVNLRLRYVIELTNMSANAIEGLRVEGDIVSAYHKPSGALHGHVTVSARGSSASGQSLTETDHTMKLASAEDSLPLAHEMEGIAPGETVRLEGTHILALSEIRPIMQGKVPLLVPLLRWRIAASNTPIAVRNFVLGRIGARQRTRLQPFRLDEPPQSYPDLGLKPLD